MQRQNDSGNGSARSKRMPVQTPEGLVAAYTSKWEELSKRTKVQPMLVSGELTAALKMLELPTWPGEGTLATESDVFPLVSFSGMPAAQYPKYIRALTAYTIAELGVRHPHLGGKLWSDEMIHLALLTTATRAGAWAAIGRAPAHSAPASTAAVRWSSSTNALVVRPAVLGDGTEMWRFFLASSPGLPACATEVALALAGAAPSQFVMGAALLLSAGEVYAMHYLEKAIRQHLYETLSPTALQYVRLDDRATWDTLAAAAIGGYRASVARQVSTDQAFVLAASARIEKEGKAGVLARLQRILAKAESAPRAYSTPIMEPAGTGGVDIPDDVSVADTETGLEGLVPDMDEAPGQLTPMAVRPPPLAADVDAALRDSIRRVPRMTNDVASVARQQMDSDSVDFGNF